MSKKSWSKYKLVKDYWTYDFYNLAINKIDYKIPIVVPSYNRYENNYFLEMVKAGRLHNWPIFVVVRESQKDLYEANYNLPNVSFLAFKDDEINNIGKTRMTIVKYFTKHDYDSVFVFDDDCDLYFKALAIRNDEVTLSRYSVDKSMNDLTNIFAMWQLTHEYLINKYLGCWVTHPNFTDFIFMSKYGENHSYAVGASAAGAVCLNLKLLKKYNLNYVSSENTGHEDIDLLIRALRHELYPIAIKYFSTYVVPNTVSEVQKNLNCDTDLERQKYQYGRLHDLYADEPYITWPESSFIRFNWVRFCKDKHIDPRHGSIKNELYNSLKKGI